MSSDPLSFASAISRLVLALALIVSSSSAVDWQIGIVRDGTVFADMSDRSLVNTSGCRG